MEELFRTLICRVNPDSGYCEHVTIELDLQISQIIYERIN